MAVDSKIPQGEPGIASFGSETWGNSRTPEYGDGPFTTTELTITASGALELDIYTVIAEDGTIAVWTAQDDGPPIVPAFSDAYGILLAPIVMVDGQTMTIPVRRSGHHDMDALVWDTSFDTDAKKVAAFEGSKSPTIFVSKGKFSDDALYP